MLILLSKNCDRTIPTTEMPLSYHQLNRMRSSQKACILRHYINGTGYFERKNDPPHRYWTPKLHNTLFVLHFISGTSKCTTEGLSCLPTKILSVLKDGLNRFCNVKTS